MLPIFLHLTQFNYLFTNYFITVVFNLTYYIYSLHVVNINLSKKFCLNHSKDTSEGQNNMYALFCSLSDFSFITS